MMYTGCAWFIQMKLDTYTNPRWNTNIEYGRHLPTTIGQYYPLYPSSLSFKCSDWSVIYRNDSKILDNGDHVTNYTFTNEK